MSKTKSKKTESEKIQNAPQPELKQNAIAKKYPESITAVALYQVKNKELGGSNWVSLKLTVEDGVVTKVESSEPNLRNIAQEQLKIDVVKTFFKVD